MLIGEDRQDRQPGRVVFDFVAHLPTSIWVYVAVGLVLLLGWAIHWYQREKPKPELSPADMEQRSGTRNLFVVSQLRQRALALRSRARIFLGASIMLLLGGVYITIWVVPIVPSYDIEEQVRALLQFKYIDTLDAVRKGDYCLYARDVHASDDASIRVLHNGGERDKAFVLFVEGDHVHVSGDGLKWERHESLHRRVETVAVGRKGLGLGKV